MARESREVWIERVRQWRESRQTAKAFAAEIGVNHHTLSHWKWTLKREEDRPEPRRAASGEVSFVELSSAPAEAEPLELVLGARCRIRIPDNFDADTLVRLMSVLEAHR